MKLAILVTVPSQTDNKFTYIAPNQIGTVENSSCTEIHITCLDYLPESLPFIAECLTKLRKNGIITVVGFDIIEIAKGILTGRFTIDDINAILYKGKQSIDNMGRIKMFFLSQRMTIEDVRLNNITYQIKAVKND